MLTAIRKWVLQTMMRNNTGVVQTLPKKDLVDLNVAITAERLARNGVDPNALKNANQVENAINQVESAEKANLAENIRSGITSSKSAKVFDLEGKEINPRSKIMGGQQAETETEILARINKENKKSVENIKNKTTEIDEAIDNASPGFAGDRKYDAQLVADDLAEKRFGKEFYDLDQRQQMELYDEAYQGLSKQRFKNKPDPEDMATGGRAGFKSGSYDYNSFEHKINELKAAYKRYKKGSSTSGRGGIMTFEQFAPLFAAENFATGGRAGFKIGSIDKGRKAFLEFMKKFKIKQSGDGVNEFLSKRQFMKDMVGNTKENEKARQLTKLKEMAEEYQKKKFGKFEFPSDEQIKIDLEKKIQPILNKDRKLNATGGRIGYKVGSVDKMRRLILKAMGAGTAGIAAAKSGIFSGISKGAGKQVAEEVVKKSTSTPPPYFFELANKIKKFGTDTIPTNDRTIAKSMKSKDGKSDYILEEDVTSGDTIIKKINKEGDEMITDVEIMEFRKGEVVRGKDGKAIKTPDEYEEVTESNARIEGDVFNDPYYSDGIEEIEMKKIIDEASDQAPSIKKAGGGIARMLGE